MLKALKKQGSWPSGPALFDMGDGSTTACNAAAGAGALTGKTRAEPPPPPSVLRQTLALRPPSTSGASPARSDAGTGPRLLLLASPSRGDKDFLELVRLLRQRDVRHLVTLGDLCTTWTLDRNTHQIHTFMATIDNAALTVKSDVATAEGGSWLSQMTFEEKSPAAPRSHVHGPGRAITGAASGITAADTVAPMETKHLVPRLHVPSSAVGALEPQALQRVIRYLETNVKEGEAVAIVAREDWVVPSQAEPGVNPLLAMGGQLALTLALRQGLPQTHRPDPATEARRAERLRDAVSQLHERNPALIGGVPHVCAAWAASESPPDPQPVRPDPQADMASQSAATVRSSPPITAWYWSQLNEPSLASMAPELPF